MAEYPSDPRAPESADRPAAAQRMTAGKRNVRRRRDFLPATAVDKRTLPQKSTPHSLRIAQYRDRLMGLLVGSIDQPLFDLVDRRSADLLDKLPDNTEVAMYSDFIQYVGYCRKIDVAPLPFGEHGVDAYLSRLMAEGKKRSTIDRRLASLVKWADILELSDPRRSFRVKTRLMEIRKRVKAKPRQAEGLRVAHLQAALDRFRPEIPRDAQDITLLFVGFETLCRQSELVRFDWEDFALDADGSGLLHLEQSKTDQDGEGDYLYLSRNTVNLLMRWQTFSGHRSGAIFRGIYSDGRMGERLSVRGVQRCFKRIAQRLDLEPTIFSGHSTRVGAAQEMIERNIDSAKVMLSGRWKTMAMLTKYSKKIQAKRSGIAELSHQLGWSGEGPSDNRSDHLESDSS